MPSRVSPAQLEEAGLAAAEAGELAHAANSALGRGGAEPAELAMACWDQLRTLVIRREHPVALKRLLFEAAYADWDARALGPPPAWRPDAAALGATNIQSLIEQRGLASYAQLHAWSIEHGQQFWRTMLERLGIVLDRPFDELVDLADPRAPRWLPGARLNITNSFFQAEPSATALIYQHEERAKLEQVSYGELEALANRIASGLARLGAASGAYVAIAMPMNVAAIAAYIACLRAGCPVVCLADSFNSADLELRLAQIPAKVAAIFTQDTCGGRLNHPLYAKVAKVAGAPKAIVASSGSEPAALRRAGDITWEDFVAGSDASFTPASLDPEHQLNVIFSSSTSTGKERAGERPKPPKAIPWLAHTFVKAATDAHLHHNLGPGRVLCWPTNLGWMMGPYSVIGALVNRATLAVYDGSPVAPGFGAFVAAAKVTTLGTVPAIAQRWADSDVMAGCDWSAIELFSSTGAPSNPQTYFHLMSLADDFAPVIEYCGGTEIGGSYNSCSLHHRAAPAMFTTPLLGTELAFPREMYANEDFAPGEVAIVLRAGAGACPPMGLSTSLLNFPHAQTYFARDARTPDGHLLREHGDIYLHHPGGFMQSNGRADDGININGIKTSSTELEGFVKDAALAAVADVVFVAARPPGGGEDLVVAFVVAPAQAAAEPEELRRELVAAIRGRNPQLARIDALELVAEIPRTASNKVRRAWLRDSWLEGAGLA